MLSLDLLPAFQPVLHLKSKGGGFCWGVVKCSSLTRGLHTFKLLKLHLRETGGDQVESKG